MCMLEDTIIARIIMEPSIRLRNINMINTDRVDIIMAARLRWRNTSSTDLAVLTIMIMSITNINMKSMSIHIAAVIFLMRSMSTNITKDAVILTPNTMTHNKLQFVCLTKSVPTPQLLTNR